MGNWVIHVEGTGAHHNVDNDKDANVMAKKFVEELQKAGQNVEHATFAAGYRESSVSPKG